MSKEFAGKFAVVRWLNDANRLSVHNQKYFMEPQKQKCVPGDEGIACYPGFPVKWEYRILAVGVTSTTPVKKEPAGGSNKGVTDKSKKQNGGNGDKQKEQTGAVVQQKAQKDLAESLLSKRTPESTRQNETRDAHKDCVSIRDFKALKDDVRTLKDDVRRLKRKLNSDQLQHPETKKSLSSGTLTPRKLGTQITLNSSAQTAEKSATPRKLTPRKSPRKLTPIKSSPTPSPPRELETPPHGMLYNSHTRSQLVDAISHTDGLNTAVKILMSILFPESYILSHSITFYHRKIM